MFDQVLNFIIFVIFFRIVEESAFSISNDFIKFHNSVTEFKQSYSNIPFEIPPIQTFFNSTITPNQLYERLKELLNFSKMLSQRPTRIKSPLPSIRKLSAIKVSTYGVDAIPVVIPQLNGFVANTKVPEAIMQKSQEIVLSRENDGTLSTSSFGDYLRNRPTSNYKLHVETSPPTTPNIPTHRSTHSGSGSYPNSPKSPVRLVECILN